MPGRPAPPAVLLSAAEALAAIRCDLRMYGPQLDLFGALAGALCGLAARPASRAGVPGLELAPGPGGARGRFLPWNVAARWLGLALARRRPGPEALARLCALVFAQRAEALPAAPGEAARIRLETGMEGFACTRCGRCCRDLDYHRECSAQDVALWRARGREDILAWVGQEPGPDGPVYRIWMRPGTPLYAESCPFLRRVPGDTAFVCTIHDVKPAICRSYPGLRKHALLTGCKGFPRP